jgi:hypothetical protein
VDENGHKIEILGGKILLSGEPLNQVNCVRYLGFMLIIIYLENDTAI